jgi:hypothetical protein
MSETTCAVENRVGFLPKNVHGVSLVEADVQRNVGFLDIRMKEYHNYDVFAMEYFVVELFCPRGTRRNAWGKTANSALG